MTIGCAKNPHIFGFFFRYAIFKMRSISIGHALTESWCHVKQLENTEPVSTVLYASRILPSLLTPIPLFPKKTCKILHVVINYEWAFKSRSQIFYRVPFFSSESIWKDPIWSQKRVKSHLTVCWIYETSLKPIALTNRWRLIPASYFCIIRSYGTVIFA